MSALLSFARQLQQQALSSNQRRILRLQGEQSWCYQQTKQLIEALQLDYFWCGHSPDGIDSISYKQILGRETSLLIINAYDSFDANAFAASEGTLRGGGLLILLTPTTIPAEDLFYHYVHAQLATCQVATIHEDRPVPGEKKKRLTAAKQAALNHSEQQSAIADIIKTVTGHRRRPFAALPL